MAHIGLYHTRKTVALLFVLMVMALLVGCNSTVVGGDASAITVNDAWARAASPGAAPMMGGGEEGMTGTPVAGAAGKPMSGTSAIYMVLANSAETADRLVSATIDSSIVESVELHQSSMQNDVMQMQRVEGIDVPAGGETRLEPGGYHVMLIGLKQPLEAGQMVSVQLQFERAGTITVEAGVRAP